MSDPKPMPRPLVITAGVVIAVAALAGLATGVLGSDRSNHGPDSGGEVVSPIKTVANAQPLAAPTVDETEVRRWAREELQSALNARAVKKPKVEGDTGEPADLNAPPAAPAPAATPAPKTPATAPQIPF